MPEPTRNPPHTVFQNNLMGVFNTLEAAIRFGVPRFVNVSSETVPGFFFPERPWLARLRAGRRGAPDPPAGPLRDRQVLLRAADGRRDAPLGHPLPDHPPELGAVGGQLRRTTSARPCATPRADAERRAVGLHRRLRPRRRARGSPPSPTSTPTRSSTSPRPTTTPTGRSPTSSATTTATPSRSASPSPAPTPPASRSPRRERLLGYAPTRSWRDYLDRGRRAARRRARAARARRHRRSARARGRLSGVAAATVGSPLGVRHRVRVDLRGRVGRVLVERLVLAAAPRRATRASRGAR